MQVSWWSKGKGKEHALIIPDNKLPSENKVPTELQAGLSVGEKRDKQAFTCLL